MVIFMMDIGLNLSFLFFKGPSYRPKSSAPDFRTNPSNRKRAAAVSRTQRRPAPGFQKVGGGGRGGDRADDRSDFGRNLCYSRNLDDFLITSFDLNVGDIIDDDDDDDSCVGDADQDAEAETDFHRRPKT